MPKLLVVRFIYTLFFGAVFFVSSGTAAEAAPVKILFGSRHAYANAVSAINYFLGSGHIGTDIILHSTDMNTGGADNDVTKALNANTQYYNESGVLVPSQAPYQIFNTSATGFPGDTQTQYNLGVTNDLVHNYAYSGSWPVGTFPPVFYNAPSKVEGGGNTGPGVEWRMNNTEYGMTDTSLSAATAASTGLMASLRFLHQTWNAFDTKAAIRQTAANWTTGYDRTNYGFGTVNFSAANALSDSQIALQPPVAKNVSITGRHMAFELYPFRQTRRVKEVLFQFPSTPAFHGAELSLSEIQALGGTKVQEYTDNTASVVDVYSGLVSDGAYLVWFTADNTSDATASFSRIDTYSVLGPVSNLGAFEVFGPNDTKADTDIPGNNPFSPSSRVFVDSVNNKIYTLSFNENSFAGKITRFDSGDGGTTLGGNYETFETGPTIPYGMSVDVTNNKIYIVDPDSVQVVRRFDSGGGGTTLGGNDEALGAGEFVFPSALMVSPSENKLYVTDYYDPINAFPGRVVRFDSGGGGTTFGANLQSFEYAGTSDVAYSIAIDTQANKVYITDMDYSNASASKVLQFSSGGGGTTFGANLQSFTYGRSIEALLSVDNIQHKAYVIDNSGATRKIVRFDSGGGGTTFGANVKLFGSVDYRDEVYANIRQLFFDAVAGSTYVLQGDETGKLDKMALAAENIHIDDTSLLNQVIDCDASGKDVGAYVLSGVTGSSIENVTVMNCPSRGLFLKSALSSAKNILFVDNTSAVEDDAGGYACTTCFDNATDGSALVSSAGVPTATSPVIDAGSSVSGRTTDVIGNPLYGAPDIGAYEYQPPYTMGTDEATTSAPVRLYGDEKFRNKSTPSGGSTADIVVTLPGTDRSKWLDLTITGWSLTGTRNKTWTESTTESLTNTAHTIGDLTPSDFYQVSVDGVEGQNISGCTSGICQADADGRITFTYTGTYSTHTFTVEGGVDVSAPVLSSLSPSSALVSGTTQATLSVTTDEAATCRYASVSGTDYASMTDFASTGSTTHTQSVSVVDGQEPTYFVRCRDSADNTSDESLISFSVNEEDALEISSLKSSSTSDSITLTWKTNRKADSEARYGLSHDAIDANKKKDSDRVKKHSITIKKLHADTPYFIRVSSEDDDGKDDSEPFLVVKTEKKKTPLFAPRNWDDPVDISPKKSTENKLDVAEKEGEDLGTETDSSPSAFAGIKGKMERFFTTALKQENGEKRLAEAKFQIMDPKTDTPIPNLPVTIHSEPQEATTDGDGIATFKDVPLGDHTLLFAYGGEDFEKNVVLGDTVTDEGMVRAEIIEIRAEHDQRPWWEYIVGVIGLIVIVVLLWRVFRKAR